MKSILTILTLILPIFIMAQINVGGEPYSMVNGITIPSVPKISTPPLDLRALAVQDSLDSIGNVPPRFGYPHIINANLTSNGAWHQLATGDWIWQLQIQSFGALSMNLLFDQYHLAPNSVLHVFDITGEQIIGGFTSQNNKGSFDEPRGFGSSFIYAEHIVIELYTTDAEKANNLLSISHSVEAYRLVDKNQRGAGLNKSPKCHTNINCSPDGDDWQDEKRGVALIVVDGIRWCTGSLINNSCNDGRAFFLTADHCLNGGDAVNDPNLDDWTFRWDYEAEGCSNPSTASAWVTAGATVVANFNESDFALLELEELPNPIVYNVYYNGWSRTTAPISDGVGIHHPSGDIKKISVHSMVPDPNGFHNWFPNPNGSHWGVEWYANGNNDRDGMNRGSSGSPLFMNNGLVIGQLHGGDEFKCWKLFGGKNSDQSDYGSFAHSWNTSPLITSQLEAWLGQCETPVDLEGGYFWECPTNVLVNFQIWNAQDFVSDDIITANSIIHNGANVILTAEDEVNLTAGFETGTGVYFEAGIGPCENAIVPNLPRKKSNLSQFESSLDEEAQENAIESKFQVYPNPASKDVFINAPFISTYRLVNYIGQVVLEGRLQKGKNQINLSKYDNGIYILQVKDQQLRIVKSD